MFSIFSLSFGNRIPPINYSTQIAFLGRILESYDLRPNLSTRYTLRLKSAAFHNYYFPSIGSLRQTINYGWEKPAANLVFNAAKITLPTKPDLTLSSESLRKDRVIMIYPQLPYNFLLYFKDRQVVHIELMFNIISEGKTNYIAVKRKVSSGNLEVDMLVERYIKHYLFIQQAGFLPNKWQAVKIELSTKND